MVGAEEKVKGALARLGVPCEDVGTDSTEPVDYPDYAHEVAAAVQEGRFTRGIVVCGTGIGVSIAANRVPGVRAAVAYDEQTARLSREHNDANVLALGGRIVALELADEILDVWLGDAVRGRAPRAPHREDRAAEDASMAHERVA